MYCITMTRMTYSLVIVKGIRHRYHFVRSAFKVFRTEITNPKVERYRF